MIDLYKIAPKGSIYQCQCCFKKAINLAGAWIPGNIPEEPIYSDRDWNEDCMMNAVLVKDVDDWRNSPRLNLPIRFRREQVLADAGRAPRRFPAALDAFLGGQDVVQNTPQEG